MGQVKFIIDSGGIVFSLLRFHSRVWRLFNTKKKESPHFYTGSTTPVLLWQRWIIIILTGGLKSNFKGKEKAGENEKNPE
jgi:hypothetical protein